MNRSSRQTVGLLFGVLLLTTAGASAWAESGTLFVGYVAAQRTISRLEQENGLLQKEIDTLGDENEALELEIEAWQGELEAIQAALQSIERNERNITVNGHLITINTEEIQNLGSVYEETSSNGDYLDRLSENLDAYTQDSSPYVQSEM